MAFLTSDDYDQQIRSDRLDVVLTGDNTLLTEAQRRSRAQMESYLRSRFDVAAIFSATGTDRDGEIVMYLVDIVLYHLHSRINPRNISELRRERYQDALDWLRAVRDGDLTPALPLVEKPESGMRLGSNPKLSHHW